MVELKYFILKSSIKLNINNICYNKIKPGDFGLFDRQR
jgi:hypothetical protein